MPVNTDCKCILRASRVRDFERRAVMTAHLRFDHDARRRVGRSRQGEISRPRVAATFDEKAKRFASLRIEMTRKRRRASRAQTFGARFDGVSVDRRHPRRRRFRPGGKGKT